MNSLILLITSSLLIAQASIAISETEKRDTQNTTFMFSCVMCGLGCLVVLGVLGKFAFLKFTPAGRVVSMSRRMPLRR
jgi:hypothetical protein